MSKMQKQSVFVMNKVHHIVQICEKHPVNFSFISGVENPADSITRCMSYRKLLQTTYFTGPDFLRNTKDPQLVRDCLSFTVPGPLVEVDNNILVRSGSLSLSTQNYSTIISGDVEYLVLLNTYSSFQKLVRVWGSVLKAVNIWKDKMKTKYPFKFGHLSISSRDYFSRARKQMIKIDQQNNFAEVVKFFSDSSICGKLDIPNLVKQLNLYVDQEGILRVHSKSANLKNRKRFSFPILLAKNSPLTKLIITDMHEILAHSGCYAVLSELRRRFYIPHYFSVVKKIVRDCIQCRRYNERTIKLNQSPYRDWRISPPNVAYRYMFLDYLGPFGVRQNGVKEKAYLLCCSCMWSRAVNLLVCKDLSVDEFLRAFQLHCFQFGLPEYCISDLGSQLVSAANVITDYLKDHQTQAYFEQNGVKSIRFDQFAKGHSQLGSMVEVCVKLVKRLITGAIRNNVLDFRDFEYLIAQTIHLVNRRPVAFKNALRDIPGDDVPEPITPEILIHGYELVSVNVIPKLHIDSNPEWHPGALLEELRNNYQQLQKVRDHLITIYQEEFLTNLMEQATDRKDRYKSVSHKSIKPGDIVLLKESFTKPNDYPLGIVRNVEVNCLGEVTGATIFKGKTRELVKRHASVIIPLLTLEEDISSSSPEISNESENPSSTKSRKRRKAACLSEEKTREILQN